MSTLRIVGRIWLLFDSDQRNAKFRDCSAQVEFYELSQERIILERTKI